MIYDKINIFLPTYKRVVNKKLPDCLNSLFDTCNHNNVVITFLVNVDDKETITYLQYLDIPINCHVIYNSDINKPHLAKFYNHIYRATEFNGESTLVSMVGDDMIFKTKWWDSEILKVANETKGECIIWCNDDYVQKGKMCVNLFTTRKVVEATERLFMCELFPSYFIDTVWYNIARKFKIGKYLHHTIIQHNHMSRAGIENDETAKRLQSVKPNFAKSYKYIDAYVNEIIPIMERNLGL